mmetsp:Transcript_156/g.505  ORF Transcript_156/g.505 Transcript_156/m.505 type:complete len:353 (+) Transcript_156:1436-2494(+)
MDMKNAVLEGYSERIAQADGAMGSEAVQICRMNAYDPKLLSKVPQEIVDRDYGCGNPSEYAEAGDVVLDLGSGSGKICYILSQVVGETGQVIGVDMNRDMVALSRAHQEAFSKTVGYNNLRFTLGSIDDLASDLEAVEKVVSGRQIDSLDDYSALQQHLKDARKNSPMIADRSVDLVVSNCVINLVDTDSKNSVLEEIFRVLRPGGRIALSDNVSNIEVPDELKNDPELWVGCYSGVYQEQEFYNALGQVGFVGLNVVDRKGVPEKTIGDVTFHSVTVTATKPLLAEDADVAAQVMYKGPWSAVTDDMGTSFQRGEAKAVSAEVAQQLRHSAYASHVHFLNEPPSETDGCCG